MQYQGTVIRPPSEALSLILQVTLGCSHNRCSFCGTYRDKPFRIRPREEILRDLAFAARYCRRQKTVFLADGDALVLGYDRLRTLLLDIREYLPWVRRVSLYGRAANVAAYSLNQLRGLAELGLKRIYMGLESGHGPTLAAVNKDTDPDGMIKAGTLVRGAGIFLSLTCLLGIGGVDNSLAHARATAGVCTAISPSQIAVLTLMILDNTELAEQARTGRFRLPDTRGLLEELREMIRHLRPIRTQFQANHASNYLSLDGRLPRDRDRFLALIDQALRGDQPLRPESRRML